MSSGAPSSRVPRACRDMRSLAREPPTTRSLPPGRQSRRAWMPIIPNGGVAYRGTTIPSAYRNQRFIPACAGNAALFSVLMPMTAVDPRVRGERGCLELSAFGPCGSSPRARGTLNRAALGHDPARFIPACAGNAAAKAGTHRPGPVHPRVRGERGRTERPRKAAAILPRARGTRPAFGDSQQHERFHPRVRGERGSCRVNDPSNPVHPRVRGERGRHAGEYQTYSGSSPRARGTRRGRLFRLAKLRFIPACAGNAPAAVMTFWLFAVHPRVRGERPATGPEIEALHRFIPACAGNARALWGSAPGDGSSPRARGTPRWRQEERQGARFIPACAGNARPPGGVGRCAAVWGDALRFIPACAGNASHGTRETCCSPVHPRVRGERRRWAIAISIASGSSPRARGTLLAPLLAAYLGRFIPACAGNASATNGERVLLPVHPRVRGERDRRIELQRVHCGSSPRARGTRCKCRSFRDPTRFIPACAGNACAPPFRCSVAPVHPRVRGERDPSAFARKRGRVHPRVRGERWRNSATSRRRCGSSPRARKRRRGMATLLPARRLHPRARGERWIGTVNVIVVDGSSPRARGTLDLGPTLW